MPNELPCQLVKRLSQKKALAIAKKYSNSFIIASDQLYLADNRITGKPKNKDDAIIQLKQASGKKVTFFTGLTLLNTKTQKYHTLLEPFIVHFRTLTKQMIHSYLRAENPYQCAGSFKSEGLGIVLFSKLQGDDPNTLIGLPLIKLCDLFAKERINLLTLYLDQKTS